MVTIDAIDKPAALRAAQGLGVFASAAAAGASAALTVFVVPRLLETPSAALLARQWQRMYDTGKVLIIGLAGTASASFAYVFWATQRGLAASHVLAASRLPLLAAGLGVAMVPYTIAVMLPVNTALMRRAAAAADTTAPGKAALPAGDGDGDGSASLTETRSLVQRWGALNLGRTAFLTTAAVTGLVAFL